MLVDDGILYKRRGIGMFVCPDARAALLHARREAFFTDQLDPVVGEARLLDICPDDLVRHIRAAMTTTDEPTDQP